MAAPPEQVAECPSCGAEVALDAKECPSCGEIFSEELLEVAPEETDAKPSKLEKVLFFGGLALVLLVGIVLLILSVRLVRPSFDYDVGAPKKA